MAKIRTEIPIVTYTYTGSPIEKTMNFSSPHWFQGYTQGALNLYFEVNGYNTDSSTRYAYLKNDIGTTLATASIVGSTPQRVRVAASSANMGYQFSVELSDTSGALVLKTAKLILIQDIGDFPLLYYLSFASIGSNSSTTSTAAVLPALPRYWKYLSTSWDGDILRAFISYTIENAKSSYYLYMYDHLGNSIAMSTITGMGLAYGNNIATGFSLTNDKVYTPRFASGGTMYTTTLYMMLLGVIQITKAISKNFSLFQTNSTYTLYGAGGTYEAFAQKFTTVEATTIKHIVFRISRMGTPADGLRVKLIEGSGPTGTLLSTSDTMVGTQMSTSISYQQYVIFTLPSPVSLTGVSDYTIVLERTGGYDATNYYSIAYDGTGVTSWRKAGGSWTSITSNFVHIFGPTGITKFESQYYIDQEIPYGLSNRYIQYEQSDWDGFALSPYYSHDLPASSYFRSELVDVTADPDTVIANTNLSGNYHVIATNPMSFPADGHEMATDNTYPATTVHASRIIVRAVRTMGSQTQKALSAQSSSAGILLRQAGKKMIAIGRVAASHLKQGTHSLFAMDRIAGTTNKTSSRLLHTQLSSITNLEKLKVVFRDLTTLARASAARLLVISVHLVGWIRTSSNLHKRTNSYKRASLSAWTSFFSLISRLLISQINQMSDLVKSMQKRLARGLFLARSLTKQISKRTSASLHSSITVTHSIFKALIKSISIHSVLIYDHIQGLIQKEIATIVRNTAQMSHLSMKNIRALLQNINQIARRNSKTFSGTTSLHGELVKFAARLLLSDASYTSHIVKLASRHLSSSVFLASFINRIRVALKTLNAGLLTLPVQRKYVQSGLNSIVWVTDSLKRQISRLIESVVSEAASNFKETKNNLGSKISAFSIIDRMKVFLKQLTVAIDIVIGLRRSIAQGLLASAKALSYRQMTVNRSTFFTMKILSQQSKLSLNRLTSSVIILGLSVRVKAFFISLGAMASSSGSFIRQIRKPITKGLEASTWFKRAASKRLETITVILRDLKTLIIREISSDLAAISSTMKMSFRDLSSFLKTATTGFSAWKVIHTIYVLALSTISHAMGRRSLNISRTLSRILHIIGAKFHAQASATKSGRNLLLSISERRISLELRSQEGNIITMAYTGDTIRLFGRFYNWSGELSDVTEPNITIFDGKGNQVLTDVPTRQQTGVYFFDYTIPTGFSDPLVFEISGIMEGTPILARSTIDRRWV